MIRSARSRGFSRRDALHQHSLRFGPNMTPMVDVVMVILVFFMASAAFVGPEWFLQALVPATAPPLGVGPGQRPPLTVQPVRLEIALRREGGRAGPTVADGVGLQGATLDEVERALREFVKDMDRGAVAEQVEVLIKPDAAVPYRDVVRIHESCQRAGVARVGIRAGGGESGAPGR